ncbi:FAD-binding and (Fe-S)-binding domain-containing protein, partial [Micromonospora sp. M42]|uniref:FAD-binding and (Fe-S)-binding domain-containing protein n=1 Tax=Micromonospora sp. M42 TaxID=457406 RepID=UPI003510CD08
MPRRACWSSTPSARRWPRCRRWWPPGRRRSSCSTPPPCGSPSGTRRRTPRCAAWPCAGTPLLLAEWQESDAAALAHRVADAGPVLAGLPLSAPARLSGEPAARAALWHIRKGLYAAVAGARPSGTTALLEDIAVPVEALAGTCASLAELFERHRYADSVIFGHAKDGNLHFMLNERFDGGAAPARYADFTEEMVDLVLGHGGTLKAEHGTGRVMAPYVRRQFGDELYEVMRELKTLCDPDGVLNPGVLLSDDPEIHMRHLKTVPTVEEEVDRCVECGYCEPVCPSRDLTTTPRQRIVLRREIAAAQAAGDTALVRELTDDYDYDAVQTCAVDGMCATACPVLINTGDLVKRLRAQEHGRAAGDRLARRAPPPGAPPPGAWPRGTRSGRGAAAPRCPRPPPGPPARCSAPTGCRSGNGTCRAAALRAAPTRPTTRTPCSCRPAWARCSPR